MTAPQQPQPDQLTYEQALVAAAALQAAPDPTAAVAALAEQLIAIRERATAWATQMIRSLWAPVNPYDGAQVQQFTVEAAARMQTAQTVVVRAAGATQARQLNTMGITTPVAPSDPVDVRRKTLSEDGVLVDRPKSTRIEYRDGDRQVVDLDEDATTQGIFNRPARTYRYLESQGVDVEEAREQALARLGRLVEDNLMLAQRLAEAEVLAGAADVDRSIIGLRRVIHPELSRTGTCGLCIVAADQMYSVRKLLAIHARCKCTVSAVFADFDPADHLNTIDIGRIYKAAGGTSGAELKRARIRIDEHGELGPVLAPAKKYRPRPKKRTPKKVTPGRTTVEQRAATKKKLDELLAGIDLNAGVDS